MGLDLQKPDEWLYLSTCVARMSELNAGYSTYPGYARRDLETAIRAGRAILRGLRSGMEDQPPEVFNMPVTARHRLDLTHDTLSERKRGPLGYIAVLRHVEINWTRIEKYLQARANELWSTASQNSKTVPKPHSDARPLFKKRAEEFTDDYIKKEKSAGRIPTQSGVEAAAKEARFMRGRDYLRAVFHRRQTEAGTPVRRGRIKKSPG